MDSCLHLKKGTYLAKKSGKINLKACPYMGPFSLLLQIGFSRTVKGRQNTFISCISAGLQLQIKMHGLTPPYKVCVHQWNG
jgi:hypothetical protein